MTENQYRLVNLTTGWADPNLVYSEQQANDICDRRNTNGKSDWAVQGRIHDIATKDVSVWVLLPQYQIADTAAVPASRAARSAREAILDVAEALKAAGKTRNQADEALTVTVHADWIGFVDQVLAEVYPPTPVLDLPSYVGSTLPPTAVIAAVEVIAADFRARAVNVRPTCGEDPCFGHEGDDEADDAIADTYDECARDLLKAFGIREISNQEHLALEGKD
jgi:hypothetical protein